MRFPLTTIIVAGIVVGLPAGPSAHAAFPLTFPAHGESLDDLPFDAYFTSGGHTGGYGTSGAYPVDMGIVRFDGTNWVEYVPGGSKTNQEDHMIFGFPLHSPVDGVVVSCWREMPDGTGCPPGEGCLSGGNHLNILTEDGDHLVYIAHMESGSIPESLCPLADVYLDDTSSTCTAGAGWEGLQDSIRLDTLPGDLPVVHKGDYIGSGGNSGSGTSAPHVHLHVKEFTWDGSGNPCQRTGVSEEIEFAESWYATRIDGEYPGGPTVDADVDASDWLPAQQTAVPFEADGWPRYLLWPDPIGPRRDDLVWGDGDDLHNVTDSVGGVLAYHNDANHLQLESYEIDDGEIVPQDTLEEGTVLDVGIAHPFTNDRDVVAAIRTSGGSLKLIPYTVSAGGTIARQYGKERTEGAIYEVEGTKSPTHDGITVAIRDGSNEIKVIDYVVDSATMAITRPGSSASGGTANDIAIDSISFGFAPGESVLGPKFQGVITAERRASDDELVVRAWEVTAGADVSLEHTEITGVEVSELDVTTMALGSREVAVVSARDADDDLWVRYYYVASDGELTPADDVAGGEIGTLATAAVGSRDAVTVMNDSGNGLKLIAWGFNDEIRRAGARKAGGVAEVAIDLAHPSGSSPFIVTLVQTLAGEVKMLVYGSNFDPAL